MIKRIKEYLASDGFFNLIAAIGIIVLGSILIISFSIAIAKNKNEASSKDLNQLELYHRGHYLELTWDDEGVVSVVPGEDMKELRIVIDGEPLWNWRPDNGT